jgi:predicted phage baseplate assembly protein
MSGITAVTNPLPATGGTDPEPLDQVRLYAPQAFRTQERAITAADYAIAAQRHPEVQRAAATRRWTGSWYTMFVTVDRLRGLPVDAAFEADMRAHLERFRLAGHDLEIDTPRFVPLDIALTVCVEPGFYRGIVKQALLERFSDVDLPSGQRGFFHPDNFTFHQPVYLSQIVAAAMAIPGVFWVDADDTPPKPNRFQRWGQPPRGEVAAGRISMGRLEIARLDNDLNHAENGRIDFLMQGGL